MIIDLTEENIKQFTSNILNEKNFKNEKKVNPYAHFKAYIQGDKIIGYIYYSVIYDRIEINQFEVECECRNKGYGRSLLNSVINSISNNITLEVNEKNLPAINLYKSVGFEKVAIRKGYYDGIDGLLMLKEIKK